MDDLFAIAVRHPEDHDPDGVHFTPRGYAALGAHRGLGR
jgi:lysophospholipase L1-like esterase